VCPSGLLTQAKPHIRIRTGIRRTCFYGTKCARRGHSRGIGMEACGAVDKRVAYFKRSRLIVSFVAQGSGARLPPPLLDLLARDIDSGREVRLRSTSAVADNLPLNYPTSFLRLISERPTEPGRWNVKGESVCGHYYVGYGYFRPSQNFGLCFEITFVLFRVNFMNEITVRIC
jgi:hypothetical protein